MKRCEFQRRCIEPRSFRGRSTARWHSLPCDCINTNNLEYLHEHYIFLQDQADMLIIMHYWLEFGEELESYPPGTAGILMPTPNLIPGILHHQSRNSSDFIIDFAVIYSLNEYSRPRSRQPSD